MTPHWPSILVRIAVLAGILVVAPAAVAQEGTPVGSSEGVTLVASGLDNPRGFTWGADGSLYVSQAGIIATAADGSGTPEAVSGEYVGGLSGNVVWIDQGCPVVFQEVLPSAGGTGDIDLGPSDLAFLNGQLYVLDDGGGAAHGNPLTPDGIYAIDGSGSARLVADIGTWIASNPVANPPANLDPDGDPFGMVAGSGVLWVTEHNSGQLLSVTPDGTITRVADFSTTSQVPTGLTIAPDGTLYVALLAGGSFADGDASVASVAPDGTVTEVWTGLTAVTAVSVAQGGMLYALQAGTGGTVGLASVSPDTGKVVRQSGESSSADVAMGLDLPISMAFGPDQGLYVGAPALTSDSERGMIVRLNTSQGHVMAVPADILAGSTCIESTPTPTPAQDATPAASPASTPDSGDSGSDTASGASVNIQNFAFSPGTITVSVGDTITWTNNDSAPHTVTANDGSFDSGTISPGETFSFTFDTAGSFDYACSFHPNMLGTVVVQ